MVHNNKPACRTSRNSIFGMGCCCCCSCVLAAGSGVRPRCLGCRGDGFFQFFQLQIWLLSTAVLHGMRDGRIDSGDSGKDLVTIVLTRTLNPRGSMGNSVQSSWKRGKSACRCGTIDTASETSPYRTQDTGRSDIHVFDTLDAR